MCYERKAAPAHILVTNQLGIEFARDAMKEMKADEPKYFTPLLAFRGLMPSVEQ